MCKDGFEAADGCSKPCRAGRFGANCSNLCDCPAGMQCDPVTGDCRTRVCPAGFSGPNCDERKQQSRLIKLCCKNTFLHFIASLFLCKFHFALLFNLSSVSGWYLRCELRLSGTFTLLVKNSNLFCLLVALTKLCFVSIKKSFHSCLLFQVLRKLVSLQSLGVLLCHYLKSPVKEVTSKSTFSIFKMQQFEVSLQLRIRRF